MHANASTTADTIGHRSEESGAKATTKTMGSPSLMVQLADLRVDLNYARELDEAWVRKIVAEWHPALFRCPLVAQRPDGSLWIIDGQHRVEAAKRLGFDAAHAIVVQMDDVRREAHFFVVHNGGLRRGR
jgi:hypothetical protein